MLGLTKSRKSLNDILSTANKIISDLEEFVVGSNEEVTENNKTIAELEESNLKLLADAAHATRVQRRLSEQLA